MHLAQQQFCESVRNKFPKLFYMRKILDCGSQDVNGNNRYLFLKSKYTGIDIVSGKNVDIVTTVVDYKTDVVFDVVISTEMLEHDSDWKNSVRKMYTFVKKGGILLITCATGNRLLHNTSLGGYYRNVPIKELARVISKLHFSQSKLRESKRGDDLYFWGMKK